MSKEKRNFFTYFIFIFICWIPLLLVFYPGIYGYDAPAHITEFFTGKFSMHHPLLYTILFGAFYKLSAITGNHIGRVGYSAFQMLILSGSMATSVLYLKNIKCPKYMVYIVLVFYALCPLNSLMSLITTKDIIFASLTLLVYIELNRNDLPGGSNELKIIALLVVNCLFRNNAVYAMFLLEIWIFLFNKQRNGIWLKRIGLAVLLYFAISTGLKVGLNAEPSKTAEMWSVPLQQMARIANVTTDEELIEQIEEVIPQYDLYTAYIADPVKNQVAVFDGKCWKIYFKCLVRHPIICIEAFVYNIEGMWNIANDPYAMNREFIIPLTYHNGAPFGAVGFEGKDYALLLGLREKCVELFSYTGIFRHTIIALAFRQAVYFWIVILNLLYSFTYRIRHKETKVENNILPDIYILCYIFTLMLAPCAATRYFYAVMICTPVMVARNFRRL